MQRPDALIEEHHSRGHDNKQVVRAKVILSHASYSHIRLHKLLRAGTPRKIVNRTLFIKSDAAVKVARGAEQVKSQLPVITFVCSVDIGLLKDEHQSAAAEVRSSFLRSLRVRLPTSGMFSHSEYHDYNSTFKICELPL